MTRARRLAPLLLAVGCHGAVAPASGGGGAGAASASTQATQLEIDVWNGTPGELYGLLDAGQGPQALRVPAYALATFRLTPCPAEVKLTGAYNLQPWRTVYADKVLEAGRDYPGWGGAVTVSYP